MPTQRVKIEHRRRSRQRTDGSSAVAAEKKIFLRGVSHGLNAQTAVQGWRRCLRDEASYKTFDEDIIHRLERIQKNVQVETDLISELLELSRIKTRSKLEPVNIDQMVAELGDLFESDLKGRGIELIVDTAAA